MESFLVAVRVRILFKLAMRKNFCDGSSLGRRGMAIVWKTARLFSLLEWEKVSLKHSFFSLFVFAFPFVFVFLFGMATAGSVVGGEPTFTFILGDREEEIGYVLELVKEVKVKCSLYQLVCSIVEFEVHKTECDGVVVEGEGFGCY